MRHTHCILSIFILQSLESDPRFITLQFSCKNGRGKPIGGSFIGTSPEFEVTFVLYLLYPSLKGLDFTVRSYGTLLLKCCVDNKVSMSHARKSKSLD